MIHKAKELSSEQKLAVEGLLGRTVDADESISIRVFSPDAAPEWLQKSWESAKQLGLDGLSMEEIDAEIASARQA
jgi:hypothetical protein